MIRNYIISQVKLYIHSKIILVLLVSLMLVSGLIYYFSYNNVIQNYQDYNRTVDYYNENNIDATEDMTSSYGVQANSDGTYTVTNPLKYYHENLKKAIFSISVKYSSELACEATILFFPVIFGIWGLILGTIDYKNKTIKYFVSRLGKSQYTLIKVLTSVLVNLAAVVFYFVFSRIVSLIAYSKLSSKLDITSYENLTVCLKSSTFRCMIFAFVISILFTAVGMLFGSLLKNTLVGSIVIILYSILYTPISKFDIKNSMFFVSEKICDFMGVISVNRIMDTTFVISSITIAGVILFCFLGYYVLHRVRSAFI